MDDAHCKTVEEVLTYFNTDPERGLTGDQVKRNQEKYGLNETSSVGIRIIKWVTVVCEDVSTQEQQLRWLYAPAVCTGSVDTYRERRGGTLQVELCAD
ncbi:hypothetical protein PR048_026618 [Dryococelus australis]|uniref:Cation-transporting P-type ATPase N-terminal domain-containing protein n=1 Tax=Dryococelus australis TaxID=614101 RepID=A0ABQ9GLU3_9NEOP|nr:hypothetical protein PR048_026618 [Dryococelus australis]